MEKIFTQPTYFQNSIYRASLFLLLLVFLFVPKIGLGGDIAGNFTNSQNSNIDLCEIDEFVKITEIVNIPLALNQDWDSCYESDILSVSVRYADCSDEVNGIHQDYYLLKIENKTDSRVLVNWHFDLFYNDICKSCNDEDNEFLFRYELKPKEIIIPNCDDLKSNLISQLVVFRSILDFEDLPKLTKAQISQFTLYLY